eukprot:TRINITY_DN8693_c1_g1_i1.p1 TRINITY_DN8693_c1_g1~~TRINITY_DN8693_c1_g1_i1.p1  ORF type:complete len:316 (+),score=89.37 TRINITY_DN8693_c1_g1_i1:64-1011(+)
MVFTHPLVGPPIVCGSAVAFGAFVYAVAPTVGLAMVLVFGIVGMSYAAYLLVMLLQGTPCCRDKKPVPSGDVEAYQAPPPLVADWMRLCGCSVNASEYAVANEGGKLPRPMTLVLGACPGRKHGDVDRDLTADVEELKTTYEVDLVVSLVEHEELEAMECEGLRAELDRVGIAHVHFPMRRGWLPDSRPFVEGVVTPLAMSLSRTDAPKTVYIHCGDGTDRTALLVSALLMTQSVSSLNLHSFTAVSSRAHTRKSVAMPRACCDHAAHPPLRVPVNQKQSLGAAVTTLGFTRSDAKLYFLQRMYLAFIRDMLLDV